VNSCSGFENGKADFDAGCPVGSCEKNIGVAFPRGDQIKSFGCGHAHYLSAIGTYRHPSRKAIASPSINSKCSAVIVVYRSEGHATLMLESSRAIKTTKREGQIP